MNPKLQVHFISAACVAAMLCLAHSATAQSVMTVAPDSPLSGNTVVAVGDRLVGEGTINGHLTNHGTVSPGLSPGTIRVTGDYVQSGTGTLVIEIASRTDFDHLAIDGNAALAGTLQLDRLGGFNPAGQSFAVLSATGGVTGGFATVSGNTINSGSAAIAGQVIYGANLVTVYFVQRPFANFALTANQYAVAQAAQQSPDLTAALNAIPLAGQMPGAFNALSPQGYEVWSDIAFAHTTILAGRMMRDHTVRKGHENVYLETGQRRGRARGNQDVRTSTYTSTAYLVGGDQFVTENLSAGGFYEHSSTVSDLASNDSRTKISTNTLGARIAWDNRQLFSQAVFGYGFSQHDSKRPVVFPGTSALARSENDGRTWFAGVTVGKHLHYENVILSPTLGLLTSKWRADGFTETDAGAFNVTVADQSARSWRAQAGLEAGLDIRVGSVQLLPRARAAWVREFSNDARMIEAAFGANTFAVTTRGPQRNSALLSVGLDAWFNPSTLLYADLSAQTGGITKILSEWRAGVAVRF